MVKSPRIALLCRTDVHLADRGPESWKGDYPAEVWSNLEQIGELAKRHSVTAVLDGGDYFHVKAPTRNSHEMVARSIELHGAYPCPTWGIQGNHDISHNNLDTTEKQPWGVLASSGAIRPLSETVFEEGALRVRVVGLPYDPDRGLEAMRELRKKEGDTHLVVIAHALAALNPGNGAEGFFGEPVFAYPDLVWEDGPSVWVFGHWHRDQGIQEVGGVHFVNVGAVSRGALVKENLERTPKVSLLEFFGDGTFHTTEVPLQVLPADAVFDLDRKARHDEQGADIEGFVGRLTADARVDPSASIDDNIRGAADFAADVRQLALEYLERARTGG